MTAPSSVPIRQFAPREPLFNLKPTGDGLSLQVAGDLDIDTVSRLDKVLAALERGARSVYIDLAAVRFTDSTGLSPFIDSAERRLLDGRPPLTITALSRAVRRVVDLLADDRDHGLRAFAGSAPA